MVAHPNTELIFGLPVQTDQLHLKHNTINPPSHSLVGTYLDWTSSHDCCREYHNAQLNYDKWLRTFITDVIGPLYYITDDDGEAVPATTWWDSRYAPARLLGDTWAPGKDVFIAFAKPAFQIRSVEENRHCFTPFDVDIFSRIEMANSGEAQAVHIALSALDLTPGSIGWYRYEYTT